MQIKKDGYGQTPEAINYWLNHRSKIADLYPSESHFFSKVIKSAQSVLDIGCAAGGSALFSRELNPKVRYIGIDNSSDLILAAKSRHSQQPNTEFFHFNGHSIPLADNTVDFSFSFGVFHHLNHWKEMLFEALRVSSQFVLIDLRLWEQETLIDSEVSYQKLAVGGVWDSRSIIPYNIISLKEFKKFAKELNAKGIDCKGFGYYQAPTTLAVTPAKKVLMLSLLFKKNHSQPQVELSFT